MSVRTPNLTCLERTVTKRVRCLSPLRWASLATDSAAGTLETAPGDEGSRRQSALKRKAKRLICPLRGALNVILPSLIITRIRIERVTDCRFAHNDRARALIQSCVSTRLNGFTTCQIRLTPRTRAVYRIWPHKVIAFKCSRRLVLQRCWTCYCFNKSPRMRLVELLWQNCILLLCVSRFCPFSIGYSGR